MDTNLETKPRRRYNSRIAEGVLLILIGAVTLLQHWFNIANYSVLLLGGVLLAWGCLSRRSGLIIPGGVLSGIGLGILIINGPWHVAPELQSGIFLLCFAFGWMMITLLTAVFTCTQWWALIPGGIMAALGGSILVTNGAIQWGDLNIVYAIILLAVGLTLLLFAGRPRRGK